MKGYTEEEYCALRIKDDEQFERCCDLLNELENVGELNENDQKQVWLLKAVIRAYEIRQDQDQKVRKEVKHW